MPKITCPDNPDCSIECPGSGYAYFVKPYGPCVAKCDQQNAGDDLIKLFLEAKEDARFSGEMVGVTAGVLSRFASDFAPHAPEGVAGEIEMLQRLGMIEADRRYNASWADADVSEVVQVIAESTGLIKSAA